MEIIMKVYSQGEGLWHSKEPGIRWAVEKFRDIGFYLFLLLLWS